MNHRNRLTTTFLRTGAATIEPPRVPAYRVGEFLLDGRDRWPQGAQYSYTPAGHELTVFAPSPSPELVSGVRRGEVRLALSAAGPVFYLAYHFDGSSGWADVPYCWHVQPRDGRAAPPADAGAGPEYRALLWISLVGADDGLIHAQRGVTLDPGFTGELNRAIRCQADAPFDSVNCALAVAETGRLRPDAARRLEAAYAWTVGNA